MRWQLDATLHGKSDSRHDKEMTHGNIHMHHDMANQIQNITTKSRDMSIFTCILTWQIRFKT